MSRYSAIWLKERGGRPAFASHRRMSRVELTANLQAYAAEGLRPLKINGLPGTSDFAMVWVGDGLDYRFHMDLSSDQYHARWQEYRDQGFHPADIAMYGAGPTPMYAGIWVRGDDVRDWISLRNMVQDTISARNREYKRENYRLIDLDKYRGPGPSSAEDRYSAIWVRTEPRNQLISNLDTSDQTLAPLNQRVASYLASGDIGFFVEDLTNGNFVAYNPDEPFYLASAMKVFAAARTIATPEFDPTTTVPFTTSDWRGESDRGFTKAVIGTSPMLGTLLSNMIDNSDTASTDLLHKRANAAFGPSAVTRFAGELGLFNLDDLTDICTVDKRIRSCADCVQSMACYKFEAWSRDSDMSYMDLDDWPCVLSTGSPDHGDYGGYYETLASTITPRTYSRFWRQMANGSILNGPGQRELMLQLLAANKSHEPSAAPWQGYGGKGGDKYRMKSWAAMAWNWSGAPEDYSAIAPQFSINVFTESWVKTNGEAEASAAIRDVIMLATDYLVSRRGP